MPNGWGGAKLKKIRNTYGLTLEELSIKSKINQGDLQSIEEDIIGATDKQADTIVEALNELVNANFSKEAIFVHRKKRRLGFWRKKIARYKKRSEERKQKKKRPKRKE